MIDSFRAHSSFPPRSLAPALLYGLITEMYSFSHYPPPSLNLSLYIFFLFILHPPSHVTVYSSIPGKGDCQSPSAASPSSHLPHVPPSIPPSIYLSLPSITVTLVHPRSPFFLSLSQSFLPLWDSLLNKCALSLCSKASSIYLRPLFSPPLHSVICRFLYVCQALSQ